jgi:hypothetical protein
MFPLGTCAGLAGGLLVYKLLEAPLLSLLRRRRQQAW